MRHSAKQLVGLARGANRRGETPDSGPAFRSGDLRKLRAQNSITLQSGLKMYRTNIGGESVYTVQLLSGKKRGAEAHEINGYRMKKEHSENSDDTITWKKIVAVSIKNGRRIIRAEIVTTDTDGKSERIATSKEQDRFRKQIAGKFS